MSKINKNYTLSEIAKILWDFKISFFVILSISIISSFLLYNFQKTQVYYEAQITVKTLDPSMKSDFFDFSIFKQNLYNLIISNGYEIREETITFYSRSVDQFGNISINDKENLESQRQDLIKVIDDYLYSLQGEYLNELAVITKILDAYKQQNAPDVDLNTKAIERVESAIKLMLDLEEDVSAELLEKFGPVILSFLTGFQLESQTSIPTNSLYTKKLNLEITYENFMSKIFSKRYIYVSDLLNVREVKTSLKIYIVLGAFLGFLIFITYIVGKAIIRDS